MTDWTARFLDLADHIAGWSKDPNRKVGCVVVGPDKEIRSTGFNGFPRGVADDHRLHDKALKLPIIVHAEENAVAAAARVGVPLKGCTLYVSSPPCCRCARSIIQAGVDTVFYRNRDPSASWAEEISTALLLLSEANVRTHEDAAAELVRRGLV